MTLAVKNGVGQDATIQTLDDLTKGAGPQTSTTLRVVAASDDPAVVAIGGKGDVSYNDPTLSAQGGMIALLKGIFGKLVAATPPGEAHIGQVGGASVICDVTLSLDTTAYAAGDVVADTQVVANAVRVSGGTGVLQSLVLIDKDDVGAALDLYILGSNVSMGAENSAPAITDANAVNILARISIAAADYADLGGAKVAQVRGIGAVVKAALGSQDLYIAAVNGAGAAQYSAAGLVVRLGFLVD